MAEVIDLDPESDTVCLQYNLLRDSRTKLDLTPPNPFYEYKDRNFNTIYITELYDWYIAEKEATKTMMGATGSLAFPRRFGGEPPFWGHRYDIYADLGVYVDHPFLVFFNPLCKIPTKAKDPSEWSPRGIDKNWDDIERIRNSFDTEYVIRTNRNFGTDVVYGNSYLGKIGYHYAYGVLHPELGKNYAYPCPPNAVILKSLPYNKEASTPLDYETAESARIIDGHTFISSYLRQFELLNPYNYPLSGFSNLGVYNVGNTTSPTYKNLIRYVNIHRYVYPTYGPYSGYGGYPSSYWFELGNFYAARWSQNNAISTFDINLNRPTFPGMIKGKLDGEVIFVDLLKAKARKETDDDCIMGRYIILDLNGEPFKFSKIHYDTSYRMQYVFWGEGSRILITDFALSPISEIDFGISGDELVSITFGGYFFESTDSYIANPCDFDLGDKQRDYRIQAIVITHAQGNRIIREATNTSDRYIQPDSVLQISSIYDGSQRQTKGILTPLEDRPPFASGDIKYAYCGTDALRQKEGYFYTPPNPWPFYFRPFSYAPVPLNQFAILTNSNNLNAAVITTEYTTESTTGEEYDLSYGELTTGKFICTVVNELFDSENELNMPVVEPPPIIVKPNCNELTLLVEDVPCDEMSVESTTRLFPYRPIFLNSRVFPWKALIIGEPYLSERELAEKSTKATLKKEFVSNGLTPITWSLSNAPSTAKIDGSESETPTILENSSSNKISISVPNNHNPFKVISTDAHKIKKHSLCLSAEKENRISRLSACVWPGTIPKNVDQSFYIFGVNRQRYCALQKITLTDPTVVRIIYTQVAGGVEHDVARCVSSGEEEETVYETEKFLSVGTDIYYPAATPTTKTSDDESHEIVGLDPSPSYPYFGGALLYSSIYRETDAENVTGINNLITIRGVEVGTTDILIDSNPGDDKTLFFTLEVWDVEGVPEEIVLPTQEGEDNSVNIEIKGNSSYPHRWASSNMNVAIVVPDLNDSKKAKIVPVGKGQFNIRVKDSGVTPWTSATIEVI